MTDRVGLGGEVGGMVIVVTAVLMDDADRTDRREKKPGEIGEVGDSSPGLGRVLE